ncbi:MAG: flagellar hook-associated protein FlgK [bacterium]|nr:flagellar hook-associated protein FlgK [bacterium]
MSGLFGLMYTSTLTLQAQEAALGVINHNVANANTPGFSRQRINFETRQNIGSSNWNIGGGVTLSGVQRISDSFLLGQMGRAVSGYGEQNSMAKSYSIIENTFGEPADVELGETTLGDSVADFLSAWQPALNPEMESTDADMRGLIVEAARVMAIRFNNIANSLTSQMDNMHTDLNIAIDEANALLEDVGDLNLQIMNTNVTESARADLMDQRDQSLNRLSELIGAEWMVNDRNQLKVYVGGRALVDHTTVHKLRTETSGNANDRSLGAIVFPEGEGIEMTVPGGEIKGIMNMINTDIPRVMAQLDNMAASMIDRVNSLHQQASGDGGGGCAIFTGADASTMAVNSVVLENHDAISLLGELSDGRDMATAIFDLHSEQLEGCEGNTIEGFYATIVGDFGTKSRSALQLTQASGRILNGLEQKLESVAGVNVDEELAQMLVVQTTYQAAAKIMGLVDEMMDTLISIA